MEEQPHRRRGGPRRDRRGRGPRGPSVLAGGPDGRLGRPPRPYPPSVAFDRLVLDVAASIEEQWSSRLGLLEYGVEEVPDLPDDWDSPTVPLASLVRPSGSTPGRLVVFRRPVEHRCETRSELEDLVVAVVVEKVAELLGVPPEDVDPRWGGED